MFDTYETAAGVMITKREAFALLKEHNCPLDQRAEMMEELGDLAEYDAQEVLLFLGY